MLNSKAHSFAGRTTDVWGRARANVDKQCTVIGHGNEYPTMHYFGNPRHTQSLIVYMILTEYFWKVQVKIAMWECC